MAEEVMAYLTYRPKVRAQERLLRSERIVPLAGAHFDVRQVHLHVDVAELAPLVDSVGDIADDVLGRHFARHRLDGLVHSVGQRRSITAGADLQSVIALIRRRRKITG